MGQVHQLVDGCAIAPQAPRMHHAVAAALAEKLKARTRFRDGLCEHLSDINMNRNAAEKQIEEVSAEISALEAALSAG